MIISLFSWGIPWNNFVLIIKHHFMGTKGSVGYHKRLISARYQHNKRYD